MSTKILARVSSSGVCESFGSNSPSWVQSGVGQAAVMRRERMEAVGRRLEPEAVKRSPQWIAQASRRLKSGM
jgi:hypothetical protein